MHILTHSTPFLSDLTLLEVGGAPQVYIEVYNEADVLAAYAWAETHELPVYVLGEGSNVVCADSVLQGVVLQYRGQTIEWSERQDDICVRASAGVVWEVLVQQAVQRGAWGIECLAGIPGLVGAAPIQNIGAYGQSLSDRCHSVRVFDRLQGRCYTLSADECEWSYRQSKFKRTPRRYCVISVELTLQRNPIPIAYAQVQQALASQSLYAHEDILQVYQMVRQIRANKSMVWDKEDPNHRSVGSFFLNPILTDTEWKHVQQHAEYLEISTPPHWIQSNGIKVPAAWLIEQSGCSKGYTDSHFPHVGLSSKHTLAIINRGGAKASEIMDFAKHIQQKVYDAFKINLQPEAHLWGF